ncbi:MAG: ATP:cob(I)alamin adenosyltransferase [Elusimicrobia bacterium]|nr:ATP:cob(I)alamin adenosyltransferase [Elusimicrobiota bacterium]
MATRNMHGSGDAGRTDLPGGGRVPKTHPRIRFFAALDELSCRMGAARAIACPPLCREAETLLPRFQQALFLLAAPCMGECAKRLKAEQRFLDAKTAELEKKLPPLRKFVLPGNNQADAALHCARAACRTCELLAWALPDGAAPAVYLNRLSSCLFALARLSSNK